MDRDLQNIRTWIRDTASHARGLAISVSGGSDSALCFHLCASVYPEKTVGIFFGSELRQREWFERQARVVQLPHPVGNEDREVMRWAHFMDYCLKNNCWPIGSRNKTEDRSGLYSHPSKMASMLPIVNLWKSEVLDLCRFVGMPAEIIESSLMADPDCGRPAEMAAIPIDLMDTFLQVMAGELPESQLSKLSSAQLVYLNQVYFRYKFKKHLPLKGPGLGMEQLPAIRHLKGRR